MFKNLDILYLHLFEIIIMLVGAFLIGFLTAWFLQKARIKKGKHSQTYVDGLEKANERIELLREELKGERLKRKKDKP